MGAYLFIGGYADSKVITVPDGSLFWKFAEPVAVHPAYEVEDMVIRHDCYRKEGFRTSDGSVFVFALVTYSHLDIMKSLINGYKGTMPPVGGQ